MAQAFEFGEPLSLPPSLDDMRGTARLPPDPLPSQQVYRKRNTNRISSNPKMTRIMPTMPSCRLRRERLGWNGIGKCDVTFSKHGIVRCSLIRPSSARICTARSSSAWENTTSTTTAAGRMIAGLGPIQKVWIGEPEPIYRFCI